MSEGHNIAAKVAFFDRPVLVVSIVATTVVGTLFGLAYLGILHY
jgi:hypothetical protein